MKDNSFDARVLQIVKRIPYGKVTTYGAIAETLGSKRSARIVGWVLNKQKNNIEIPAHRVVNKQGLLTGKKYFNGVTLMQDLLISEGVKVVDNLVVDMNTVFWKPN